MFSRRQGTESSLSVQFSSVQFITIARGGGKGTRGKSSKKFNSTDNASKTHKNELSCTISSHSRPSSHSEMISIRGFSNLENPRIEIISETTTTRSMSEHQVSVVGGRRLSTATPADEGRRTGVGLIRPTPDEGRRTGSGRRRGSSV